MEKQLGHIFLCSFLFLKAGYYCPLLRTSRNSHFPKFMYVGCFAMHVQFPLLSYDVKIQSTHQRWAIDGYNYFPCCAVPVLWIIVLRRVENIDTHYIVLSCFTIYTLILSLSTRPWCIILLGVHTLWIFAVLQEHSNVIAAVLKRKIYFEWMIFSFWTL